MTLGATLRRADAPMAKCAVLGCPTRTPNAVCAFHVSAVQAAPALQVESLPTMLRRLATVSRSCACGTVIVAETNLPSDVWTAMRRHNFTPAHVAYSEALTRAREGAA